MQSVDLIQIVSQQTGRLKKMHTTWGNLNAD